MVIIGAGIAGLCSGISLLENDPHLNVLILERNYLPLGASTRNAGFACFGSPSELLDDLQVHDESKVFKLFNRRYQGIQKLLKYTANFDIDLKQNGGFELFHESYTRFAVTDTELQLLNQKIDAYTGIQNYFVRDHSKLKELGFTGFESLVANQYESCLNPVKMLKALGNIFTGKRGHILYGAELKDWTETDMNVQIRLQDHFTFFTRKLLFCVNGFTQKLLPQLEVKAARNLVMVLESEKPQLYPGCFHMDRGYVYWRSIDGKLLIGGGRNHDLENEYTDEFGVNEKIKTFLLEFAETHILQTSHFKITDQWSGILGLGHENNPIIRMISNHVAVAVRLGGIGIALGSLVGEEAALLLYKKSEETR